MFDVRLEAFIASSALRHPETRCCIVWQMDTKFPEAPTVYVVSSTKTFLSIYQITKCHMPGHNSYLFYYLVFLSGITNSSWKYSLRSGKVYYSGIFSLLEIHKYNFSGTSSFSVITREVLFQLVGILGKS